MTIKFVGALYTFDDSRVVLSDPKFQISTANLF